MERRSRQTLDECLPIALRAPFVSHKQVNRCTKAIFDNAPAHALDGLCRHSISRHGPAYHEISGSNLDGRMRRFGGRVTVQPTRCMAIAPLTMAAVNGA